MKCPHHHGWGRKGPNGLQEKGGRTVPKPQMWEHKNRNKKKSPKHGM